MAKNALTQMNFHFTLGYSAYFICGAYLSKIDICKRLERIIYILGGFGFISTIVFTALISSYLKKPTGVFYGYFTLNVLFESIAVFVFFKKHCTLENASDKVKMWIWRLSKYSFGAYLVHVLILEQLDQKMGWNSLSLHPIFSIPIIVSIVFGISFCISALLNHFPVLRKYIV